MESKQLTVEENVSDLSPILLPTSPCAGVREHAYTELVRLNTFLASIAMTRRPGEEVVDAAIRLISECRCEQSWRKNDERKLRAAIHMAMCYIQSGRTKEALAVLDATRQGDK